MATQAKTQIYYINMGGTVGNLGAFRYAWRARKDAYDNIGAGLGVVKAKDTDKGLIFGANSPKPARVRLSLADGTSVIRFCEPDKLSGVLTGGTINGKLVKVNGKGRNVNKVDLLG
jgi:hypothetical protein